MKAQMLEGPMSGRHPHSDAIALYSSLLTPGSVSTRIHSRRCVPLSVGMATGMRYPGLALLTLDCTGRYTWHATSLPAGPSTHSLTGETYQLEGGQGPT